MADIQDFNEAATILQNVDVSDIFTSLAMGIARAQEKMDDNSIEQIGKLAKIKVGDRSLLELGFAPTFYAFQRANISCSIILKMAQKESLDVKVNIYANYAKTNNLSKNQEDGINTNNNRFIEGYSNYPKAVTLTMKANEESPVKVNDKSLKLNHKIGCHSMAEEFKNDLLKDEKLNEVILNSIPKTNYEITNKSDLISAQVMEGFAVISKLKISDTLYAVLKITKPQKETITLNSTPKTFELDTDFKTSLEKAHTANEKDSEPRGEVSGFSKDGKYWEYKDNKFSPLELAIFFKHDNEKETVAGSQVPVRLGDRIIFDENLRATGETGAVFKNDKSMIDVFKKLIAMLKLSEGKAKIKIIGATDKSGTETYNDNLGKHRANALRSFLIGLGCPANSIISTSTVGESQAQQGQNKDVTHRKAYVQLDADYMIIEAGSVSKHAKPAAETNPNHFIVLKEKDSYASSECKIVSGDVTMKITAAQNNKSLEEIKTILEEQSKSQYYFEIKNEILYLLQKEAILQYTIFSKDPKGIKVELVKKTNENFEKENTSHMAADLIDVSKGIDGTGKAGGKKETGTETGTGGKDKEKPAAPVNTETFAIGGSVDVHYARSFDMSLEGNASMSAELISLPPPAALTAYLNSIYGLTDTDKDITE